MTGFTPLELAGLVGVALAQTITILLQNIAGQKKLREHVESIQDAVTKLQLWANESRSELRLTIQELEAKIDRNVERIDTNLSRESQRLDMLYLIMNADRPGLPGGRRITDPPGRDALPEVEPVLMEPVIPREAGEEEERGYA